MNLIQILLLAATLLCSLTAGFLFAFSVVIMPGIERLDDGAFVRAFQVMDRIIQDNHPIFIFVWVGSVIALLGATIGGLVLLTGAARICLIAAAAIYLAGVQLPTFTINIPLNNAIQAVDVETVGDETLRETREAFESRWNRWNGIRTGFAVLASGLLMVVVLLL